MKRKLIVSICTALALGITACSASAPSGDNSAEISKLQAQIEELQKENDELKEQLAATPETTVAETAAEETTTAQKGTAISVGDVITTENMEITIKKIELSYDVLPDDTSGFYTHYEADAGNVYFHIDTDVKNVGKQNLPCTNILSATVDYNDGYTYNASPVPEDGNTGFTYANITSIKPLETLGVRFLAKCPQELEETDNPLFVVIEPEGTKDSYIITVR